MRYETIALLGLLLCAVVIASAQPLMKILRSLRDWLGWETVSEIRARHNELINLLKLMAENQAEAAAEILEANRIIRANTDQVIKGQGEIVAKIKRLEDIIAAGGPITQELKDAVASLRSTATEQSATTQALDDVVPDPTAQS